MKKYFVQVRTDDQFDGIMKKVDAIFRESQLSSVEVIGLLQLLQHHYTHGKQPKQATK